jgi:hypothetical protein
MNRQNDTKNYLHDATCQIHPLYPLTTLQESDIDMEQRYIRPYFSIRLVQS